MAAAGQTSNSSSRRPAARGESRGDSARAEFPPAEAPRADAVGGLAETLRAEGTTEVALRKSNGRKATNGRRPAAIPASASFDENPGNSGALAAVSSPDVVNTEDQHLIDECLSGRMSAFDELVSRYQDRLYNSLVRILGSPEDARDVSQEAWVHAFQGLGSFRGNSAFYSWLFRIAFNASVSEKRRNRLPSASLDAIREKAGIDPADLRADVEPSHRLEVEERQTVVRAALSEMSEEFRTVLILKEMDDLSYEEISEIVGCPIGTVRSRIHRARLELREKLRHLFPGRAS